MKCTNQILEQYFCVYYNYYQDNWSDLLPLAESAYNNILNATTNILLFFANKDYYLNINIYLEQDITSSHIHEFTISLDKLQSTLKMDIFAA